MSDDLTAIVFEEPTVTYVQELPTIVTVEEITAEAPADTTIVTQITQNSVSSDETDEFVVQYAVGPRGVQGIGGTPGVNGQNGQAGAAGPTGPAGPMTHTEIVRAFAATAHTFSHGLSYTPAVEFFDSQNRLLDVTIVSDDTAVTITGVYAFSGVAVLT